MKQWTLLREVNLNRGGFDFNNQNNIEVELFTTIDVQLHNSNITQRVGRITYSHHLDKDLTGDIIIMDMTLQHCYLLDQFIQTFNTHETRSIIRNLNDLIDLQRKFKLERLLNAAK